MGNRYLAAEQDRESHQAASAHPAGIPNRELPAGRDARGWEAGPMTLRCLLVDDSPRFLQAARGLLEREGVMVVGVASTSAQALQQAHQLRPEVVLVDLDLGGDSGLELARRLHQPPAPAGLRVILVSTHAEQDYADLIAASPAVGFLPKAALSARAIGDLLNRDRDRESGGGGGVSGRPGR